MKIVQIILLASIFLLFLMYFSLRRNNFFDKIIVFLLAIVGFVIVILPDSTTKVAHLLGVGRGVDLILYFTITFFTFILLIFYAKIRNLQKQITQMARNEAIKDAKQSQST